MALFEINEKSSIPIWLQLKNRFIYLITSGYSSRATSCPPCAASPRTSR
ncbi:MAG: hypothetical protein UCO86_09910 [Eggerthella lenta]|nr:hypothetical protein [Eggerthella lenta]